MFVDVNIVNRFITPLGFYGDIYVGVGYYHSWTDAVVYSGVNKNGNLIKSPNYGFSHLMINGYLTIFGWDFEKLTGVPLLFHIRSGFLAEYPYNNFMMPHVATYIGFTYKIKPVKLIKNEVKK